MLNVVRAWILLSTLLVASGWVLSALHQLAPAGYGVVFAAAGIAFFLRQRQTKWRLVNPAPLLCKFRSRFKRSAPMLFLVLVSLALLAGALYAPLNGSSTTYRIPRIMHWLAAGHWHWIRTLDVRINVTGNGFEWLCTPLVLLTHTDRLLFLVNWFPFLLLPGLVFSVFTRLGVRPRVAWWWMWLLPSGWCFILQAASTLNDAFGTAYILAAVDFGLRARTNKSVGSLWLAMLAAALFTGVKQTNIPLALLGLVALWPGARWLFVRPLSSLAVAIVCLLVSGLPLAILNWQHTGSWNGITTQSWSNMQLTSPGWGIIGNAFCLTIQNFKPPIFPFVNSWNAAMDHFLQTPFGSHFKQFEDFGRMSFGAAESTTSFGAGICLLLLISFFAARRYQRMAGTAATLRAPDLGLRLMRWAPWAALMIIMAKVASFETHRYLSPYYMFLCLWLLAVPGQSILVRRRWWQFTALSVLGVAAMLVIISRDRPLFPSQTVFGRLTAKYPGSKFISHAASSYAQAPAFEAERLFFREHLPPDAAVLGYAAISRETESLLWLPYGKRRVQIILPDDTPEQLRSAGIKYAVISKEKFLDKINCPIEDWIVRYNGILLQQQEFIENPYDPPERYYLVRLQSP